MCKKSIAILLALAGLLSLSACWDNVEISKLLIVAGIGLDVDDAGKVYHATVEIVNVQADGGENIAAEIVEGDGITIHSAIQNAMLMTGGTMFSNHCKVIVIGDKLARRGINEVVDMILRSPDFRKTVDVLVAKDATAKSILKKKTVKNDILCYELSKILDSNAKTMENTIAAGVYQIHEVLISDCAYFVAPAVYARENNGGDVLEVEGCAVFTEDKLQGFLDGAQSKLLNIVVHDGSNSTIAIKNAALSKHPIDVKITKSDVYLTPSLQGDVPRIKVFIRAEATLEGALLPHANLADDRTTEQLQSSINGQLSAGVKELVAEVQSQCGSDIFEFYREFEDSYRWEWPGLQRDWSTRFRGMEVSVASDVWITGSGLVGNYAPKAGDQDTANALP